MPSHIRLYSDPTALACTLAIAGPINPFRVGQTYEGRLSVTGQHGSVSVVDWSGNLPPGTTVTFDAVNSQVVVDWPAAQDVPAQTVTDDLDNLNFEQGDTGWDKGAGWTIMQGVTAPYPEDAGSLWQAQFANESGNSTIMSHKAVQVDAATVYTATIGVQQGASSKNHAGAAVRLEFYDVNMALLYAPEGNYVKSGSDSHWNDSSLTAAPPPGAKFVKGGAVAYRAKENEPLWVDGFRWNGAFSYHADATLLGHGDETPLNLTVNIRDARGCKASWSGEIRDYALYPTSQLYPIEATESAELTGGSLPGLVVDVPPFAQEEALLTGGSLQALSMTVTVVYRTYTHAQDDADSPVLTGGSLQALSVTLTTKYSTYTHAQDDTDSPLLTGGSLQALSTTVVAGYETQTWAQDDTDSPLLTGGSLQSLSMQPPA